MLEVIKDSICIDCAAYICNDELPPDNTPEEDQKIIDGLSNLKQTFKTVVIDFSYSNEFSQARCACCGTTKAGERTGVTLLRQ